MNARTPLLVGLVMVIAVVAFTWFVTRTSEDRFAEGQTYYLYADFTDASGIRWKTRVQINGLDVGKIEDIQHVRDESGRLVARVKLRLLNEYEIFADASIKKAAESLLGDYRLDLDPGTPIKPKLKEGDIIKDVQSYSDLDAIQSQLREVAVNVNRVTESLSDVLAGPQGEGSLQQILGSVERSMLAVEKTTSALSQTIASNEALINRMIRDLGAFTATLGDVSGREGELKQIVQNLAALTERLNTMAGKVSDLMGVTEPNGPEEASLRETLNNLNTTLANVSDVSRKINEGQGTVGRLINEPALINKVEETVDGTNELLGGLARLQIQIELRSEYVSPFQDSPFLDPGVKNTLGVRVVPKPDKYYILEAVSDPRGVQERTTTARTIDGTRIIEEKVKTEFEDLKFSAQFAKRYYFLSLRFGIIENTGGLGATFHALEDRMELRFDAFDFDRRNPRDIDDSIFPRFRSTAMFEFFEHLHVQGGIDDPFNPDLRTWFIGGVLRFTDNDLKSLLTVAPSP